MRSRLKCLPFLVALLVLMPFSASAAILTITQTGKGSGTIDNVSFPMSNFVITSIVNTANRQSISGGFSINNTSASIQIDAIGTFDFLTATHIFVNNSNMTPGFSRGADLFDGPTNPAFSTWNMLTPIGPISGSGFLMQWNNTPVNTNEGVLVFNDGSSATTFTAVPEPVTLSMLVLGGCTLMRRRRSFISC